MGHIYICGPSDQIHNKTLQKTNINISYKTNNTIGNILTHNTLTNTNNTTDKYNKSGIYQLTCKDCNKKYIGQTGHSFYTMFREHFNDLKHGNRCSKFAQHLLENRHSIGPIDEIMEVLHIVKKGKMMDTLEKFHIYKETKLENQINDKNTIIHNILFDTIIHKKPGSGHPYQVTQSEQH